MGSMTSAMPRDARWFYVWMAGICVSIAFGGFILRYRARLHAEAP